MIERKKNAGESVDQNILKNILDNTLSAIEDNKSQIYSVYETTCEEIEYQTAQLDEIKKELAETIKKVDAAKTHLQRERQRLVIASKKFSEQEMQELYKEVDELQKDWQKLEETERKLQSDRNSIELRLTHLIDMKKKTEKLTIAIGSVASYLTSQLGNAAEEFEAVQEGSRIEIQIIQAHEEERKRISRDLHDSVAQDLASSLNDLNFCLMLLDRGKYKETKEVTTQVRDIIKGAVSNVRNTIFDMRPMSLDDQGLAPAVHNLCSKLHDRSALAVKYDMHGEPFELPKHIETALYRIVQESLNNVIKHSGQKEAVVKIGYASSLLNIVIEDKGKGFDTTADVNAAAKTNANARIHYGLASMKERARQAGAELRISSGVGAGTKVRIQIPKATYAIGA